LSSDSALNQIDRKTPREGRLVLVLLTAAAIAPFLNKAFHIDDPLFLWMAQQITKRPLDPYGFSVNWSGLTEPMWTAMQNPPLCSYYIAAIGSLAGWSEPVLHLAFLIWPISAVLGTFAIARRLCTRPFLAGLLTLFTPVFLLSATNIMCDLMLLALWVWSIELWLGGIERQNWLLLIASAVLATAACLTKYFGISLVPLLAAYTLARDGRVNTSLVPLLIPVAGIVAFEVATQSNYGVGVLTGAALLSRQMASFRPPWFAQFLTGLAFAGGCLFTAIFFQPPRRWRFWIAASIGLVVCLLLFRFSVPLHSAWAVDQNRGFVQIEGGIFVAIGAGILALAVTDLVQHRDAPSLLLFLWTFGTFSFTTFCNWSITGRTILPMLPAVAILLARRLQQGSQARSFFLRGAGIIPAAVGSLLITVADYRQAASARDAAREFQTRFKGESAATWFESHWGFQYYMQRWAARALDAVGSEVHPGDVLILPSNNTAIVPLPLEKISTLETAEFSVLPWLSTHGRGTGAAFYSSARGPIPWAIGHVAPETYYVSRFR